MKRWLERCSCEIQDSDSFQAPLPWVSQIEITELTMLYIYTRILLVAIRIKSSWLSCRGVVLILLHTVVVCSL